MASQDGPGSGSRGRAVSAATQLAPVDPQLAEDVAPAAPRAHRLLRVNGLALQPVGIAVACLLLYLYVSSQRLDAIEVQTLNRSFITAAVIAQVKIAVIAAALILVIAIPLGIVLSRPWARRVQPVVLALANAGQAFPAVGLLVLLTIAWGIGLKVALTAFVAYGILPTLRNTLVGLQQVDQPTVQAARGMGMTSFQALLKVELPLSVPVILAGIRTTLILTVGVATLATFVNAGGLGDIIVNGIKLNRTPVLVTGSVIVASIALLLDWVGGLVEERLRPSGT